jgi:hypothetical protein
MKKSLLFGLIVLAVSCCLPFKSEAKKEKKEKLPIVFMIDDPPINTAYLMRKQMEDAGTLVEGNGFFERTYLKRWREMEKSTIIPNEFLKRVAQYLVKEGVKGKTSLLPNPGGYGYLDGPVKNYSEEQKNELINIFKKDFSKNFDINPEILTHTMGMDLKTGQLTNLPEYKYVATLNEEQLTDYFAKALQTLKNVGIVAPGITQCNNYSGDFNLYSRAVLAAEKRVNNISKTYYFNDAEADKKKVDSKVMINDGHNSVVSVVSAIKADEPFWYALYGEGDPQQLADYFISADGKTGRFIDLLSTNSPIVFHAHGQTLYSNGTEIGFKSLQEVIRRTKKYLGDKVVWMKVSEFADWTLKHQNQH